MGVNGINGNFSFGFNKKVSAPITTNSKDVPLLNFAKTKSMDTVEFTTNKKHPIISQELLNKGVQGSSELLDVISQIGI